MGFWEIEVLRVVRVVWDVNARDVTYEAVAPLLSLLGGSEFWRLGENFKKDSETPSLPISKQREKHLPREQT